MDTAARPAAAVTPRAVSFRSVFAVGEFRALWLAQILSVAGDQLARVAMTVLVYDQTHSSFWSALTYAVTLVPWVFGGLALSGLADRLPRRQLMVGCDLARMLLVGVMALLSLRYARGPGLLLMVALLFAVTLLDSPFKAARSAMIPDILTGDLYVLGIAVSQTALQSGMVAGFALGGIVVAVLHAGGALSLDAATFLVSALLVQFGVRRRPAAARPAAGGSSALGEIAAGIRLVFGRGTLRTLVLFGWLVTFYIVPMGLAAPLADGLRAGLPLAVTTGLIFAAGPLGTVLGAIAFSRLVPAPQRQAWLGPLAVTACGVLLLLALRLDLAALLAVLVVSGAGAAYQLAANAAFVAAVPPERRGQAFGLANGGMQVFQGLWIVLAGAIAAHALSPGTVVAVSGGIGAALAAALALTRRRATTRLAEAAQTGATE
ncbi:MAG TPA: MFS transporter [Streptosporangiaceae bacterium]